MDNHGCKGCLTPSLCITYPPNSISFQRSFLFFLPFQLDKIKVGGDSCLPQHFQILKVSSPYYRTGDSAGEISIKRGYLKSLGFILNVFYCLLCLFYFSGAFWELTERRILFPDSSTSKIGSGIVMATSLVYAWDWSI